MAPPAAIDVVSVSDTQGIVIPDALTVNGVSSRRAKAGKLNGGTAAFTSSDYFKHPVSATDITRLEFRLTTSL
jgi:aromatic amino acid aminotransferase I